MVITKEEKFLEVGEERRELLNHLARHYEKQWQDLDPSIFEKDFNNVFNEIGRTKTKLDFTRKGEVKITVKCKLEKDLYGIAHINGKDINFSITRS